MNLKWFLLAWLVVLTVSAGVYLDRDREIKSNYEYLLTTLNSLRSEYEDSTAQAKLYYPPNQVEKFAQRIGNDSIKHFLFSQLHQWSYFFNYQMSFENQLTTLKVEIDRRDNFFYAFFVFNSLCILGVFFILE